MTIASSGAITATALANEWKGGTTTNLKLSDFYRNTTANSNTITYPPYYVTKSMDDRLAGGAIPTSGAIKFSNFRNKFSGYFDQLVRGGSGNYPSGPSYKGTATDYPTGTGTGVYEFSDRGLMVQGNLSGPDYLIHPEILVCWDYYTGGNFTNYYRSYFTLIGDYRYSTLGYHFWSTLSWGNKSVNRVNTTEEYTYDPKSSPPEITAWYWVDSTVNFPSTDEYANFYLYR